jgi:four helix bundle protein
MENILNKKSTVFAVRVIKLYQFLADKKKEYVLSKQILRSGTAIGALIMESEADFVSKLHISLKEANETRYWIYLLKETNYIDDVQYESMTSDVTELIKMLVKSIKTSKNSEK